MNSPIIQEFLLESFENLSSISTELTTYEKNPSDKELVNSIFRKVHTLKGSAGFLGFQKLQEVTHCAETLLDLIREGSISINSEMIDVLLETFDICIKLLKSVEDHGAEMSYDSSIIKNKLNYFINPSSSNQTQALTQENSTKIDERVSQVREIPMLKTERFSREQVNDVKKEDKFENIILDKIGKIEDKKISIEVKMENKKDSLEVAKVENIKHENSIVEEKTIKIATVQDENSDSSMNKSNNVADSVVRVNVQLLDKIMNVVGELVLNRNQILQYANSVNATELNRLSQQLNIITSELQGDIMTTRMQPVGSVLSKFERIVRDLARSQNKKIKLEIIGKDTELDKTLLEAIRDPLTHLIRNSVDHGVELPETRRARGKNEEGKIIIRSYHEGGQVSIEIKDDGNGIDSQKVLAKALQKGIVSAEQAKAMSTKQIQNIIFMPGFSTADQVTNISGRGVGMDVVKSNIEKIGGTVDIQSNLGEGTTFKLKIPLTLAIVPALVVLDKGETFAIPQISLVELVRLDASNEQNTIEKLYDSEFFRLRGDLIPIFRLSDTLRLDKSKSVIDEIDDGFINVVVLNAEGRIYGVVVDSISDTEEIVVKPLSPELKTLSFFAGATIMGDGKVALILDALGFYNFADKGHGHKLEKMNQDLSSTLENSTGDSQELLICELGDHRSYAIPLILVNRLEEFKASQIEWTGDQAVVKYGDYPMPLINVEDVLHLKGVSVLEKAHLDKEALIPCVVVKIRGHLFGFLVSEIRDIAVTNSEIHSESVDRKGLLGTIFLNDRTITMLDVHSILEDLKIGKSVVTFKTKNKGRILLVEDSPLFRKVQTEFLEENGYEVITANHGKNALDILQSDKKFNLIISDLEMPVMDGWSFAEECTKSKDSNLAPIIAVSAKVTPKDREKSKLSGFKEHLEKLNKEELLKSILSYIA